MVGVPEDDLRNASGGELDEREDRAFRFAVGKWLRVAPVLAPDDAAALRSAAGWSYVGRHAPAGWYVLDGPVEPRRHARFLREPHPASRDEDVELDVPRSDVAAAKASGLLWRSASSRWVAPAGTDPAIYESWSPSPGPSP